MFKEYRCTGIMFSNNLLLRRFTSMAGRSVKRTYNSTRYTKISSQVKKQKKESSDVTSSPSLSPEQLERIATNKAAALMRLNTHQHVPDGIEESWRIALNKEFGKEYFKSVRHFYFGLKCLEFLARLV